MNIRSLQLLQSVALMTLLSACASMRSQTGAASIVGTGTDAQERSSPAGLEDTVEIIVQVAEIRAQWQWNGNPVGYYSKDDLNGFPGTFVPMDIVSAAVYATKTPFYVKKDAAAKELIELTKQIKVRIDDAFPTDPASGKKQYALDPDPRKTGGGTQWLTVTKEGEARLAFSVNGSDGKPKSFPHEYKEKQTVKNYGNAVYWILFRQSGISDQ